MRPSTPTEKDLALLRRSSFRCEYCRIDLRGRVWHRDHIDPTALGGADADANLAVACPRCNSNKAYFRTAIDPLTLTTQRLFHPRLDHWDTHFRHLRHYVVGRTPVGRATAVLLFRQTRGAPKLAPLPEGLGSPLLPPSQNDALQLLYGQRKALVLGVLERELDAGRVLESLRSLEARATTTLALDDLAVIEYAAVLCELWTTRTRTTDLRFCLGTASICNRLCERHAVIAVRRPYFQRKMSAALRQLAVHALAVGEPDRARACELASRRVLSRRDIDALHLSVAVGTPDPGVKGDDARWRRLMRRAVKGQIGSLLREADRLVLHGPSGTPYEVEIVDGLGDLVAESGYGSDDDLHHGVLLMRRWLLVLMRWAPEKIPGNADRLLRQWVGWHGGHSLRSFVFGANEIAARFDVQSASLVLAAREIDDAVEERAAVVSVIDGFLR